jgi:NADH-quinone oxidoreductase subunit N
MSVLTSLVMAYGLSFVYGLNGTTAYQPLNVEGSAWAGVAVSVLVVTGFLAKMTAAPFHFWAPDASEGAPSVSVAFVGAVAKVAPLYAMVRVLSEVLPVSDGLSNVILISAVVSIPLGILAALPQNDVRRLVAYSGIANAGYMMLGISAATSAGYASAVFLVFVYALCAMGLMLVVAQEGSTLQDLAGLVKRRPVAAWSAVSLLFSIIGFPPMVGFYGKIGVLSAAYTAGYFLPTLLAVLMSVVAGGYAFGVIRAMFTPGEGAPLEVERPSLDEMTAYPQWPVAAGGVIVTLAFLSLALGIVAEPLINLLQASL